MIQRAVEESGIPTIIISALPTISARSGAPRGVAPIVPIGANAGAPNDPKMQRKILVAALENLVAIDQFGKSVPLAIEYR